MNKPVRTPMSRLALSALAVLSVSSCSLPPEVAWRQIQKEGLIPFVMNEWNIGPSSPGQAAPSSQQMMARKQPASSTTAPVNVIASSTKSADGLIGPPSPSNATPSPAMIDSAKTPVAAAVAGLPGYVRTPFTNPPRLVDVRGMTAGSKVVCPFTNRPFLVPSASAPTVAAAPAPQTKPAPVTEPKPAPSISPTLPAPSTVAALTKPAPSAPPTPQTKPQPAPNQPPSAPAPQPKTEAQDIPFGSPIAGRPGFVNSPYAAKHQLVDVTGLPSGMEVKCPYTGKLFRVPPHEQAQGKTPAQSPPAPEKK